MADPSSSSSHHDPIVTVTELEPIPEVFDDRATGRYVYGEGVRTPLIICFHGSGETCSPNWDGLATRLRDETPCGVLLYNRAPGNQQPMEVAAQIWDFLHEADHRRSRHENIRDESASQSEYRGKGPYLLVAHSYGGAFARAFVQHLHKFPQSQKRKYPNDRVMGLVLVETGQEGGLDPRLDEQQIRHKIMGNRPVCVIRGNTLIEKRRELEDREQTLNSPSQAGTMNIAIKKQQLKEEWDMYHRWDANDERLKRRQLGLSNKNDFVSLPGCGHHVIRHRPDAVVAAVQWVLENVEEKRSKFEIMQQNLKNSITRILSR
ncbi:Alpha/Beta hydrolase protein [Nemania abortiva]|nr:Alpha/Beta hydrolase protein [Nemania abortiva]